MAAEEQSTIGIILITGFLGSGKTTFVNNILSHVSTLHKKDINIGVIENEFAVEFGVENELIDTSKISFIEEIIEFGQGCICCSSSGEFLRKLYKMVEHNNKRQNNKITHVLIETTGLADPYPIIKLIQNNKNINQHYRLLNVISVIDCSKLKYNLQQSFDRAQQSYKNEVVSQIMFADYMLLNKIDLLTDKIQSVKDRILRLNSNGKIITCKYGIMNEYAWIFKPNNQLVCDQDKNGNIETESKQSVDLSNVQEIHHPLLNGMVLKCNNLLNDNKILDNIVKWLYSLCNDHMIYRIKGCMFVGKQLDKFIIQGVGDMIEIKKTDTKFESMSKQKQSIIAIVGFDVEQHSKKWQQALNSLY